jgi:hypothetical protein
MAVAALGEAIGSLLDAAAEEATMAARIAVTLGLGWTSWLEDRELE